MSGRVRKAVIPAAGLGTRLLPATKVIPKEMMPIVDVPAIQIVVEEILASGIEEVIFITGRDKISIIDHFDTTYELEDALEKRGKTELLERTREVSGLVRTIGIRQKAPLGLGHAVLCAKAAVGDEPFAVLLPDDLFFADPPATRQLLDAYDKTGLGVVGLEQVPWEHTSRYGVIDGDEVEEGLYKIRRLVEKPQPEEAPSNLGLPGRYVLPARVFDYLEETERGVGGEIELTDALDQLAANEGLFGLTLAGRHNDVGSHLGYLQANVTCALERPDLGPAFREWLRTVLG